MKDLLDIAIKAGIAASKEILRIYEQDFEVYKKQDLSPVTDADLISTQILEAQLRQFKIPIISEEKEIPKYSERVDYGQYFLIDPLDGTKEFISKTGEFCINIALIENNIPSLGLIFDPLNQTIVIGGKYTEKVELVKFHFSGEYEKVKNVLPAKSIDFKRPIRLICSRRTDFDRLESSAKELFQTEKIEIITKGSALKFIDLALDRADYYLRYGKTMEWDIAPGFAILKQLNGSIDQIGQKHPIQFNKENLLNPAFIAYNNK